MLTALKRILKMCGHAFTITVHERLDTLEQRSAETDNALLQASIRMAERLPAQVGAYAVIEAPESVPALARSGNWVRLIAHLYSHVRSRTARVIGECPELAALAAIGYEIGYEIGCEVGDEVGDEAATNASETAGSLGLLIAESPARLPQLSDECHAEVAITEAASGFAQLTGEMQRSGYPWFLVIHGEGSDNGGSFYANYPVHLTNDAGHAFFFRDRETFAEAQSWCAALLKRTYFRFPPGPN